MFTWILLVYRPEASSGAPPSASDPFDGVEVFGMYGDEEACHDAIEPYQGNGWKWHYERVSLA